MGCACSSPSYQMGVALAPSKSAQQAPTLLNHSSDAQLKCRSSNGVKGKGKGKGPSKGTGKGGALKSMGEASEQKKCCVHCGKEMPKWRVVCPSCSSKQDVTDANDNLEAKQAAWIKSLQAMPIDEKVPWSQASEMLWCHGGSSGAFLLKFPMGAICVKTEALFMDAVKTAYVDKLAAALKVRLARSRAVLPDGEEADDIRSALGSALPLVDTDRYRVPKHGSSFHVIEYLPGCAMMGTSAHCHLQKHRDAERLWSAIGRLTAFDMLINNFDRLPLAWSNDGNLGNVMLSSVVNEVVGIDQTIYVIRNFDGLLRYTSKVQKACIEARDGLGENFDRVCAAIDSNTALQASRIEMEYLRSGCLKLLNEIGSLYVSGELSRILIEIRTSLTRQFGACDVSQCDAMVEALAAAIAKELADGFVSHAMQESVISV